MPFGKEIPIYELPPALAGGNKDSISSLALAKSFVLEFFEFIFFNKRFIFFLKCILLVMLFLIPDIFPDTIDH